MKRHRNTFNKIIHMMLFLLLVQFFSCVSTSLSEVNSLSEISNNEVIVTGKLTLVPALKDGEQKLGIMNQNHKNKLFYVTDSRNKDIAEVKFSDLNKAVHAKLGDAFYIRHKKLSFYLIKGFMLMETGNNVLISRKLKVNIRRNDRAIYIGNITFYRDEFFRITRVRVVNEYAQAVRGFRKKFGSRIKLRKSLAVTL